MIKNNLKVICDENLRNSYYATLGKMYYEDKIYDSAIYFSHKKENGEVELDTREIRAELGDEIPLSEIEVLCFIRDYINEQYINL